AVSNRSTATSRRFHDLLDRGTCHFARILEIAAAGSAALSGLSGLEVPTPRDVPNGAQEELKVEPQRPAGHVEIVDCDHLLHGNSSSHDLPRTGHPRREVEAA